MADTVRFPDEVSASFTGELIGPGEAGYEQARAGPQRPDRQASRAYRPVPHRPGYSGRGHHRPRAGDRDIGARRRAQRRRPGCHGRRPDDRPGADEGDPGRPGEADHMGAGRGYLEGTQPGRGLSRARHHRRGGLQHRHCRADPGRRGRLADGQVRTDHRQPAGGRGRHRRRPGRHGQRRAQSGLVLGPARRRRQLRRRYLLRVPGPPGGHDLWRHGRPSRQPCPRGVRLLSRPHPGGPGRADRVHEPVRQPRTRRTTSCWPWSPATAAIPRARRQT